MWWASTHGARRVGDVAFAAGDWFVFGCETRGLDPALRRHFPPYRLLRLPMYNCLSEAEQGEIIDAILSFP